MSADTPRPSLESELQRLTHDALSPLARYGHVTLLLAASVMSVLIGALLATEQGLPGRTQAAFSVLLAMGLGWVIYAVWALRQRHPLLGRHRVIAGRMAVGFTGIFFAGCTVLGASTGHPSLQAAAGVGASLLALAVGVLLHAQGRVIELRRQRQALQQQIDAGS